MGMTRATYIIVKWKLWNIPWKNFLHLAALNAISEQELAQMMSPQAMRNFMYEQNRRKNKNIKILSCEYGCDYKTKDVAIFQQHIRFVVVRFWKCNALVFVEVKQFFFLNFKI